MTGQANARAVPTMFPFNILFVIDSLGKLTKPHEGEANKRGGSLKNFVSYQTQ